MKNVYLIAVVILASSCFTSKPKTPEVETPEIQNVEVAEEVEKTPENVFGIAKDDGLNSVARSFSHAVLTNDVTVLGVYIPTVEVARELIPEGDPYFTDADIQENMLKPLNDRFVSNFDKIQAEMKEHDVDRALVTFKEYKYTPPTDSPSGMGVLEVVLNYNDKDETVPVTVYKFNEKWYVFEILNTTHLFD